VFRLRCRRPLCSRLREEKGWREDRKSFALQEDEVEEERDEWDLALVTAAEHILFSKHEVLLDNEESVSVFQNKELLTGVKRADRNVLLGGAAGVRATDEGNYRDIGMVWSCPAQGEVRTRDLHIKASLTSRPRRHWCMS
jgi:hypothetical protein